MTNRNRIYTAIISFVLGTILFLIFFLTNYRDQVITPGIIFVIIAGIVNTVVLFKLLKELLNNKEKRRKNLMTSVIILLNIPIAAIYLHFVLEEFGKNIANL